MQNFKFIFIFLFWAGHSVALVEFPKSCLESADSLCHFGTVKRPSRLEVEGAKLFLSKETLLKREKGIVEWISGTVLFEVSSKTDVQFKNFSITLQKGQYLFFGSEGKLKVDVLDGNFKIDKVQVTEGFQGTFAVLDQALQIEPLQAINLKDHLVRYANAKNLTKEQTIAYLDEFKPKHENYIEWASELNQSLVKRSIALEDQLEKEKRLKQERARLALERQKKAYFEKVFER